MERPSLDTRIAVQQMGSSYAHAGGHCTIYFHNEVDEFIKRVTGPGLRDHCQKLVTESVAELRMCYTRVEAELGWNVDIRFAEGKDDGAAVAVKASKRTANAARGKMSRSYPRSLSFPIQSSGVQKTRTRTARSRS
ncbi:hypothetical protein MY11210_000256 [Beauveria gryllotalpidicola]